MKRFVLVICVCLFGLSLIVWPSPTLAHSVLTDYRLIAEALEVQSSYSTGEALAGADVVVYAPNDPTHPWLEGKTDPQGKFQFQPDASLTGDWTVRIGETGGDHGDLLSVPVSAAGVDLDKISQNPFDQPHDLASGPAAAQGASFGRQVLLAGVLLSGSLGVRWLTRWRRFGK